MQDLQTAGTLPSLRWLSQSGWTWPVSHNAFSVKGRGLLSAEPCRGRQSASACKPTHREKESGVPLCPGALMNERRATRPPEPSQAFSLHLPLSRHCPRLLLTLICVQQRRRFTSTTPYHMQPSRWQPNPFGRGLSVLQYGAGLGPVRFGGNASTAV